MWERFAIPYFTQYRTHRIARRSHIAIAHKSRERALVFRRRRQPRDMLSRNHDFAMVSRLLGRSRMSLRQPHTDAILLLGSLALGGCAYKADSFSYAREPFSGVYMTVDCLDVAIDHQSRRAASKNVITYAFGNRCDDPVVVDLASVRVFGRAGDGKETQLYAFDPANEIRALRIDGRAVGREAIEYPSDDALKSMCVDAGSITHSSVPRWVCFEDRD